MKSLKLKAAIRKPFKHGKCTTCHSLELRAQGKLCNECEVYSNQDYVGQRDLPLFGEMLENANCKTNELKAPDNEEADRVMEPPPFTSKENVNQVPSFAEILRQSDISPVQAKVLNLYFLDELSFSQVGTSLGFSKQFAQKQYVEALKKIRNWLTISLLVKGDKSQKLPSAVKEKPSTGILPAYGPVRILKLDDAGNFKLMGTISIMDLQSRKMPKVSKPHLKASHGGRCPRCEDRVFCVDGNFRYCMNCLWNSDAAEELYGTNQLPP